MTLVKLFARRIKELGHKHQNAADTLCHKSLTSDNPNELDDLMALQQLAMKEGCSGTIHPMYAHNDRKWRLMSVLDEHHGDTNMA